MNYLVPEGEVAGVVRSNPDYLSARERVQIMLHCGRACSFCATGPWEGQRLGVCLIGDSKATVCYVCALALNIKEKTLNRRAGASVVGPRAIPITERICEQIANEPKLISHLRRKLHSSRDAIREAIAVLVADGKIIVNGQWPKQIATLRAEAHQKPAAQAVQAVQAAQQTPVSEPHTVLQQLPARW